MIQSARIAFGGMAGIPKRAEHVEACLTGQKWDMNTVKACMTSGHRTSHH